MGVWLQHGGGNQVTEPITWEEGGRDKMKTKKRQKQSKGKDVQDILIVRLKMTSPLKGCLVFQWHSLNPRNDREEGVA